MAAAAEDVAGIPALALVQVPEHPVNEDLGKADNGIERGAQFMTHAGQELALGAIGGLRGILGLLHDFLHLFPLGDIRQKPVRVTRPFPHVGGGGPVLQPDPFAVFPADPVFHTEGLFPFEQHLILGFNPGPVAGMDAVPPPHPFGLHELGRGVAEDLLDRVAHINQLPVPIPRPHHVGDIGHQRAVLPLAGAQGLFGLLAVRNVLNDRLEFQRLAVRAKEPPDGALLPDQRPIKSGHPVLERNDRLHPRQGLEPAQRDREVLVGEGCQEIGAE